MSDGLSKEAEGLPPDPFGETLLSPHRELREGYIFTELVEAVQGDVRMAERVWGILKRETGVAFNQGQLSVLNGYGYDKQKED